MKKTYDENGKLVNIKFDIDRKKKKLLEDIWKEFEKVLKDNFDHLGWTMSGSSKDFKMEIKFQEENANIKHVMFSHWGSDQAWKWSAGGTHQLRKHNTHAGFAVSECGKKVTCLEVSKATHRMLESDLFWYQKN